MLVFYVIIPDVDRAVIRAVLDVASAFVVCTAVPTFLAIKVDFIAFVVSTAAFVPVLDVIIVVIATMFVIFGALVVSIVIDTIVIDIVAVVGVFVLSFIVGLDFLGVFIVIFEDFVVIVRRVLMVGIGIGISMVYVPAPDVVIVFIGAINDALIFKSLF